MSRGTNQEQTSDKASGDYYSDTISEAREFICPRKALKQFVNAEITNQQLLDESMVLVNGVRIALNLQLVE